MKMMNSNLPTEDVWYEICLRLPLESIFKFKCISKVWCSNLSNPNFINQWYKLNISSLPWGLISFAYSVEDHSPDSHKLTRGFAISYPNSHSQFASHHQNGFSLGFFNPNFTNMNDGQQKIKLFLSGSSNGLVLCRAIFPDRKIYFVCNPLTQKWVSFPPPPPLPPPPPPPEPPAQRNVPRVMTGFMCNDGCFSSSLVSTSYKIICIPKFEAAAKEFKVHMFFSELGQWNVVNVSCPQYVTWNCCAYDNLITHNGVFYWFQKMSRHILAVSAYGNECRLIKLPDGAIHGDINLRHRLGESEGLICYAIIEEKQWSLSVWVLGEDWSLLCKDDKFHDMLSAMKSLLIEEICKIDFITELKILGFSPVDKNVVILAYDKHIWAYNTRTKGYEPLSYPSFLSANGPVSRWAFLTFAFKPWPSVLPPSSWKDASMLDVQI